MQFLALLSLAASAAAYQVTFPTASSNWTSVGPNKFTWDRVSSDALNFTLILTNQDASLMGPTNPLQLQALVDGTLGTIQVNAPSTFFPVGSNFRINMVKDTENLNTILAQSPQFDIVAAPAASSVAHTSTTGAAVAVTPTATGSPTAGSGTAAADSSNTALNPSASSSNGAVRQSLGVSALGLAVLGAVALVV